MSYYSNQNYYGTNTPIANREESFVPTGRTTDTTQYESRVPVDNSEGMSPVAAIGMQTAVQSAPKAIMNSNIGQGFENAYNMGKGFVTGGMEGYTTARNAAKTLVGDRATADALAAGGKEATEAVGKAAGDAAKNSFGGLSNSAMSGFGGAIATDLLTKGKVDKDTMLKGGAAMAANMLLPGSGVLAAPLMSVLGLKGGTEFVPYRQDLMGSIGGYNEGTVSVATEEDIINNAANNIDNIFDNRTNTATNIEMGNPDVLTTPSGESVQVPSGSLNVGGGPVAGTPVYDYREGFNEPLTVIGKQQQSNMMLPLGGLLAATLLAKATKKKKKKKK